jgi:hypothetical protein
LSGGPSNPNGDSGSSKASPINFFAVQSNENINEDISGSKFDSRQPRKKSL